MHSPDEIQSRNTITMMSGYLVDGSGTSIANVRIVNRTKCITAVSITISAS